MIPDSLSRLLSTFNSVSQINYTSSRKNLTRNILMIDLMSSEIVFSRSVILLEKKEKIYPPQKV